MRLLSLVIAAAPAAGLPLTHSTHQLPMGLSLTTGIIRPSSNPAQAATHDELKQFLFPSKPTDVAPKLSKHSSLTDILNSLPKDDTPSRTDAAEDVQLEISEWARKWKDRQNAERRLGQAVAQDAECFCAGGSICCVDKEAEEGVNCAMGPCGI